jgi:hypothetical protein
VVASQDTSLAQRSCISCRLSILLFLRHMRWLAGQAEVNTTEIQRANE